MKIFFANDLDENEIVAFLSADKKRLYLASRLAPEAQKIAKKMKSLDMPPDAICAAMDDEGNVDFLVRIDEREGSQNGE